MEETAQKNSHLRANPQPATGDEDRETTQLAPRRDLVLALSAVNQARAIGVLGNNVVSAAAELGVPISASLYLANLGNAIADQILGAMVTRFGSEVVESFLEAPLPANDIIERAASRIVVP
jgi:hypothetical protein